jgi:site-specific recombinase XerD
MRPFESFLAPKMEEYIQHRVSLGYNSRNLRSLLSPFDRYLKENEYCWDSIEPKLFLELRRKLKGEPSTINGVLSGVRNFFQFLVLIGHYTHNPLRDLPAIPVRQYLPYIFSSEQIEELLLSIKAKFSNISGKDLELTSVYLSILLLAKCGLRISESLSILVTHYCQNEGTIYIEKTKFQNDRLIPAPKSVLFELEKYLRMRDSMNITDKNPNLLIDLNQNPLSAKHIYEVFHQAVKDIGIHETKMKIENMTFGSPTPHCLRHSFAVNILNHIRDRGESIWEALPILSIYMGHRRICSTTRYLTVLSAEHRQDLLDFFFSNQEIL